MNVSKLGFLCLLPLGGCATTHHYVNPSASGRPTIASVGVVPADGPTALTQAVSSELAARGFATRVLLADETGAVSAAFRSRKTLYDGPDAPQLAEPAKELARDAGVHALVLSRVFQKRRVGKSGTVPIIEVVLLDGKSGAVLYSGSCDNVDRPIDVKGRLALSELYLKPAGSVVPVVPIVPVVPPVSDRPTEDDLPPTPAPLPDRSAIRRIAVVTPYVRYQQLDRTSVGRNYPAPPGIQVEMVANELSRNLLTNLGARGFEVRGLSANLTDPAIANFAAHGSRLPTLGADAAVLAVAAGNADAILVVRYFGKFCARPLALDMALEFCGCFLSGICNGRGGAGHVGPVRHPRNTAEVEFALARGDTGEVVWSQRVSAESVELQSIGGIVQRALDSFSWSGSQNPVSP